jgi:DNA-binding Xre family transcriptional regulator
MSNYTVDMIRWRLNAVMAEYFIGTSELAEELGKLPHHVSNLKNRSDVPRLSGKQLANICNALNRILIKKNQQPSVTIADLIDYQFDDAA